jgi:hypothetical protein
MAEQMSTMDAADRQSEALLGPAEIKAGGERGDMVCWHSDLLAERARDSPPDIHTKRRRRARGHTSGGLLPRLAGIADALWQNLSRLKFLTSARFPIAGGPILAASSLFGSLFEPMNQFVFA